MIFNKNEPRNKTILTTISIVFRWETQSLTQSKTSLKAISIVLHLGSKVNIEIDEMHHLC